MQTRQEKIKFIKEVKAGRVKIEHLKPKDLSILIALHETRFFIDGNPVKQEEWNVQFDRQTAGRDILFNVQIGD